jgi:hypothetical protein
VIGLELDAIFQEALGIIKKHATAGPEAVASDQDIQLRLVSRLVITILIRFVFTVRHY